MFARGGVPFMSQSPITPEERFATIVERSSAYKAETRGYRTIDTRY